MYKKSKDLAFLIGVSMCDGSTTIKLDKKKGNRYRFQLGSVDKEFVDKTADILEKNGLHCTRHVYETSKRKETWNDMNFLTVSNKDFVLWIRDETEHKTKIPSWIKLRKEYEINFVNGVLSSDGWVGKTRQGNGYKYSVGLGMTDNWVYEVNDILRKYGVDVKKENKRILKSGKLFHWFQFNLISFINSPFKFSIKRKDNRLKEYLKTRVTQDSSYYSSIGLKGAKARWSK